MASELACEIANRVSAMEAGMLAPLRLEFSSGSGSGSVTMQRRFGKASYVVQCMPRRCVERSDEDLRGVGATYRFDDTDIDAVATLVEGLVMQRGYTGREGASATNNMRRTLNLPPRESRDSDSCITLYRDGVAREIGANTESEALCSWTVNQYCVGSERMVMLRAVLRILSARDDNNEQQTESHERGGGAQVVAYAPNVHGRLTNGTHTEEND